MKHKIFSITIILQTITINCFAGHSPNVDISTFENNALYIGEITLSGAEELVESMKKINCKNLFITSGGGSSEAGMMIGDFISKNSISVIAIGRCHSSCANYIFLPSKDKQKLLHSKIGLHGGAQSYHHVRLELLKKIPKSHKQSYINAINSEATKTSTEIKLLKTAGVNPNIILHSAKMTLFGSAEFNYQEEGGKMHTYKTLPKLMSNYELWFPAEKDYKKWGIKIREYKSEDIPEDFMEKINSLDKTNDIPISNI